MVSVTLMAYAQERGPNKLIESLRYASVADDALKCSSESIQEPIKEAIKWTSLAIRTVRGFRTADYSEQGRAASFLARQVQTLSALETRQRHLNTTYMFAIDHLQHSRLISAYAAVSESDVPECDVRFRALRGHIDDLRQQVETLISDGDARQGTNRRAAREYYERALRLNAEDVSIKMKISGIENATPVLPDSRTKRSLDVPRSEYHSESAVEDAPAKRYTAVHKHANGQCHGELLLGRSTIVFESPQHSFRLTRDEIRSVVGNEIVDSSGHLWTINIDGMTSQENRKFLWKWRFL